MTGRLDISNEQCDVSFAVSPATALVPDLPAAVDRSIAAARSAFCHTRDLAHRARLRVISKFRQSLAERAADLACELAKDRTPEEFLAAELIPLLDACCFLEKNAAKILRARKHGAWTMPFWLLGTRHEIIREPLGVVLIIGASNYPLYLPGVQVLQALAAGNAVLLKPAPAGLDTAHALQRHLVESGLSRDLLQVLPIAPEAAIHALSRHIDKVFLTGSEETGRKVLIHAATAITPAVVELSGCDAAFIFPDADLDLAARCIAFGLTLNSGRTCIAPRRAFVWKDVATPFLEKLQQALVARPKTIARAHPASDTVANLFEATTKGAHLINGAICKNGLIEGPIVLANLSNDSAFATAENWGPYLSVVTVSDETEALRAAEKSRFGLGASIFTRSTTTAFQFARKVRAGSVCINDLIVPTADGRLPFGGRRLSGFGVTRGPEGLLEMTAPKVISTRSPKSHLHLMPAEKKQFEMLSAYCAAAYASGSNRLRGVANIFSTITRKSKPGKNSAD